LPLIEEAVFMGIFGRKDKKDSSLQFSYTSSSGAKLEGKATGYKEIIIFGAATGAAFAVVYLAAPIVIPALAGYAGTKVAFGGVKAIAALA
jgi:hypothetical protein